MSAVCEHSEQLSACSLGALDATEAAAFEAHLAACARCQNELETLRSTVEHFAAWPRDVVRPAPSLQSRLAERIAAETGAAPVPPPAPSWREPDWEEVCPGITVKMLATDDAKHVVSMLVHLEPGVEYPPHTHAGIEELHLLDGELWIDERKLFPGEYSYAEPGTGDKRVWSETGCTCVLITSTRDVLS